MNDAEIFEVIRKLDNGNVTEACAAIRAEADPARTALQVGLAMSITSARPVSGYMRLRRALDSTAVK